MKNRLLFTCIAMFCLHFTSYSQVAAAKKVKHTPINAGLTQQSITSLNRQISVVSDGDHDCRSHDFTQKHYQSLGLWDQFQTEYDAKVKSKDVLEAPKTPGTNTIAVIFHVVHNPNNPAENVSNAAIMSVYNDIVQDYQLLNSDAALARPQFTPADCNINFCLATKTPTGTPLTEVGVVRVSTTEGFYDIDNGEENKMKSSATGGSQIWDRSKYLNVWICDITNGASSGVAGYAYRPSTTLLPSSSIDGIVIDYNLGVNNDNILTHEIGHYLGLDHTWGGSGSCTSDDGFSDTPNTAGPSFNYSGSCSGNQMTCSGIQTQYENYMDYSNCTVMFTQLQANYMLSILTGVRASLLSSPGCDPVNQAPVANFTADIASPIIIPQGGTVNFTDLSTNAPTSWTWNFGGGASNSTAQNPSVVFNTVGTYTVTLTAANAFGSDNEIKTNYVQVVPASTGMSCDTLRNWNKAAAGNFTYYNAGAAPQWGYIPGHNLLNGGLGLYNTQGYAEKFVSPTTSQVRQVIMPIFKLSNQSGAGQITLRVYTHDVANDIPNAVLATQVIPFTDLTNNAFNVMDFATPASVTGTFWVSYELNYGTPQDSMVVGVKSTIAGGNDGFAYRQNNIWRPIMTDFLISNVSIAMDVLLSNGPAPVANFTMSDNQFCTGSTVNVNGSTSVNATSYDWYLTDNPLTTIIAQANTVSTTFNLTTAGNRTIYLFADGSCQSDEASVNFTVSPQITASVVNTATTCGYDDGTITVNSTAGGVAPYSYSLDGTNFQSSNVFSNLSSGIYTVYISSAGVNCLRTYNTTINSSSEFVAGISPNTNICAGTSTTLTATGGTSYEWYEGPILIGNTATIVVTPAISTQYSCVVTNASNCESIVYVDVAVEICNGIEEYENAISIYPNPVDDLLNVAVEGKFNYSLYDSRGRLLTMGSGSDGILINMELFESGMYLLELELGSKKFTSRIIKK